MNCVMIILKINMATNQSYHLLTLTVKFVNEDVYEGFSNNKKMFGFSNFWLSQNAMMIETI